jgi:uncharacterized repeat protein (TIGR01451 family)
MAANLGLLTPASAQTSNLVFLSTADTRSDGVATTSTARTAFQNEATAQGLNFVDGTDLLSGSGTLPVDANTKLLVLFSVYAPISASSLTQISNILAHNPGLEVVAFIDGCLICGGSSGNLNLANFMPLIQAIEPASWTPTTAGSYQNRAVTAERNTLSTYATSSSFAALPQILGYAYEPLQNVPTDYALYVDTAVSATASPTTSNVYGLFIPQALSSNGQGACTFMVSDVSGLGTISLPSGTQPAQANAIAHAFVSAALDPNSACGLPPTVQFTKDASTTAGLAAGNTVVYTLTATNLGAATATNIVVDDPIPPGIASYSWHCDGADCPATDDVTPLHETIASMAVGDSVTYTITATVVSSGVPASIKNSATLSGNVVCSDGTAPPCLAEVTNPFTQADMQASGPVAVSATVNTPITVTTTCTNNGGPTAAANVTCAVTGGPTDAVTVCSSPLPVTSLAVDAAISCDTTFTPTSAAPITLVTTAGSDTPDLNHANDKANTTITPRAAFIAPVAASIPTLSEMALLLLAAALGVTAVAVHRRGR